MKAVYLAALVASANAFQWQNPFSNNPAIDTFKQELGIDSFLSENNVLTSKDESVHVPELMEAWKDLLNEFGADALKKKIDHYKQDSYPGTFSEKVSQPKKQSTFGSKEKSDAYEVVEHKEFSNYQLRIKESNPEALQLDWVRQYTGYLDLWDEDRHFFYWFFESRNDPKTDPIILWLNGGPGCSSSTGLFFELGPSSINADILPEFNPYSWNSNASVIFLDQPAGVGYSYVGEAGTRVGTSEAAGKDVYAFLELFFSKFPQFRENKFHIAGESYGGHYIPAFAHEIISHEDRTFELSSVLIGNGITDPLVQAGSYKPMACGEGGYKQVISDEECAGMDTTYNRCVPMIKACYNTKSAFTCVPASLYCGRLVQPYQKTGLNWYDIRKPCEGTLCYPEISRVDEFLNSEWVKNVLDVDPAVKSFQSCSNEAGIPFYLSGDGQFPSQELVADLLEHNIPVLLYSGDKDYICNWLGNHMWSDKLEYSGQYEFQRATFKPFVTEKNVKAGEVKNYDIFTFLRVYDAGHMVPYDKPEVSLDFLNKWLAGDFSLGTEKSKKKVD
ncbi:carboxypeptidase Y [[Candida] anglica]|uniref:Carboxypeptidase n=1 Tax=[Candida] anglica TaxID=148631 RepID=A0ABP0EEH6_9ASCO